MPNQLTTSVLTDILQSTTINTGETLYDLSCEQPVLLVFLRHFGCTFCREAMSDLGKRRKELDKCGVRLVLVHMADEPTSIRYFKRYNLEGVNNISDPDLLLYKGFGLKHGTPSQLFGLSTWVRGFKAGIVDGHGIGWLFADGFQMPGVFVIQDGEVRESFVHETAADRPDYDKLVQCCLV
jgi:peroxiredoxin